MKEEVYFETGSDYYRVNGNLEEYLNLEGTWLNNGLKLGYLFYNDDNELCVVFPNSEMHRKVEVGDYLMRSDFNAIYYYDEAVFVEMFLRL